MKIGVPVQQITMKNMYLSSVNNAIFSAKCLTTIRYTPTLVYLDQTNIILYFKVSNLNKEKLNELLQIVICFLKYPPSAQLWFAACI